MSGLGWDWPLSIETDWHTEALCKTRPDLNWFPTRGESLTEQKAVCADSTARIDCLAEALQYSGHDDFGVWGGTSELERRRIRSERAQIRQRGPAVCGTRSGYMVHQKHHEAACDACKGRERCVPTRLEGTERPMTWSCAFTSHQVPCTGWHNRCSQLCHDCEPGCLRCRNRKKENEE